MKSTRFYLIFFCEGLQYDGLTELCDLYSIVLGRFLNKKQKKWKGVKNGK